MRIKMCLLFLATALCTGQMAAQSFIADQFLNLQPGLTAEVVEDLGSSPCPSSTDPNWNDFVCNPAFNLDAVPSVGLGVDVFGSLYQIRPRPSTVWEHNFPTYYGDNVYEIERRQAGLVELIAEVPERRIACDGLAGPCPLCLPGHSNDQTTHILRVTSDIVNGAFYFAVESILSCDALNPHFGIVRISGLPTIRDVIPQGPSGPTGPEGQLGPQGSSGPAGPQGMPGSTGATGSSGPQGPPGPLLTPCPDADGDGFRDCTVPGCFPYGGACGDCDDHDREVNPAQSERTPVSHRRDGKDNDCNGLVDDPRPKKN